MTLLHLRDQSQDIGISLESGALYLQVVGCHHIQVFLLKLGSGITDHVSGLHGKSAEELALLFVLARYFRMSSVLSSSMKA